MSDEPPRRSRRAPRRSNEATLPILPILLGVVILGFVIGAGVSLVSRRASSSEHNVIAVASPAFDRVTPAPTEKPTPEPTDAPAVADTSSPDAEPSPDVSSTPRKSVPSHEPSPPAAHRALVAGLASPHVAAASSLPRSTASPASVARTGSSPEPPPSPLASSRATASARQTPAAMPTATPAPTAATGSASATSQAFPKLAGSVVRQYLAAVGRGDEESAYAALGAAPGDRGASLGEASVVDSRAKVSHLESHALANGDALVNVVVTTAAGPYYGTYTVHRLDTGAAVITSHELTKP